MQFFFTYGFLFFMILTLKEKSVSAQTASCEIVPTQYGRLRANCTSKGFTSIPQTLSNMNFEILDVSYNNIATLNKDDLKNYPNLYGLVLVNLPVTSFPAGFFQHTPSLKMLNISTTQISNLKDIPVSVKELNFTRCKFETLDLSYLINLNRLFLRNNNPLRRIPVIAETAPLEVLDVKYCDLPEANYSQIAPFCQLGYFGLNSTVLAQEKYVVQCCGLRKWGFSRNLTGFKGQNCSRTESHPYCHALDIKFDEKWVKKYSDCIRNLKHSTFMWRVIIGGIVAVTLAALAFIGVLYHHYKIHLPSQENQNQETSTESEAEVEAEYYENATDSDQT